MQPLGKILIATGILIAAVGLVVYLGSRFPFLPFGRLPGDIQIERGNFRFFFPLATCIIISILLSLILYIVTRLR